MDLIPWETKNPTVTCSACLGFSLFCIWVFWVYFWFVFSLLGLRVQHKYMIPSKLLASFKETRKTVRFCQVGFLLPRSHFFVQHQHDLIVFRLTPRFRFQVFSNLLFKTNSFCILTLFHFYCKKKIIFFPRCFFFGRSRIPLHSQSWVLWHWLNVVLTFVTWTRFLYFFVCHVLKCLHLFLLIVSTSYEIICRFY